VEQFWSSSALPSNPNEINTLTNSTVNSTARSDPEQVLGRSNGNLLEAAAIYANYTVC